MSEIRAEFEPGNWQDFSKDHEALRVEVEGSLARYLSGRSPDPIGVWGAFGAGKTQFLFWVAEKAVSLGLIPLYFHLNDLLDGLPDAPSPDTFRNHATAFADNMLALIRSGDDDERLLKWVRDSHLLEYVKKCASFDPSARPVLLIDEVEQAYRTLRDTVRADDRSPLRAWLEEPTQKICAFAVGSLYVLGRADRERLKVWPIPAVRPSYAKRLLPNLSQRCVNSLWWLSRGKPRHLMKAARRYAATTPTGAIELSEFLKELDSVSQAPYETDSQNVVPAAYTDQLRPEELGSLLCIGPCEQQGDGKAFRLDSDFENEFIAIVRQVFKMDTVAFDLVRYTMLLLEAVSVDGQFAMRPNDTAFLLRLSVDFLLEYERERLERDTVEGGASLKKLLEVHDSAQQKAAEIFWTLNGKLKPKDNAACSHTFEALASAFPLPTTSPTLFGTKPAEVRSRFDDSKQPVFSWKDEGGNSVAFLTSIAALNDYAETSEFRQRSLSPSKGVLALVPYDADDWNPSGFLLWLSQHGRVRVLHLPLALTDFLLSLRDYGKDGTDPFPIAEQAESFQNIKRQVAFYRSRLAAYVADVPFQAKVVTPTDVPRRLTDMLGRVADKDVLALTTRQAFETLSPQVLGILADLRDLVTSTKSLWGRGGFISLAEDMLPHRSPRTDRLDAAKIIEDVRLAFSSFMDSLHSLASFVTVEEIEYVSDDAACKTALRGIWHTKRQGGDDASGELAKQSAQLADIVTTVQSAKATDTSLRKLGILASLGTTGILLEAMPQLEKVNNDVNQLLKSKGGADKRLAVTLLSQFLNAFMDAVESDLAKAKVVVRKIRESLAQLQECQERISEASGMDAVRFAALTSQSIQALLDKLRETFKDDLGDTPTLDAIAEAVEELCADFDQIEGLLSRLNETYLQLKRGFQE